VASTHPIDFIKLFIHHPFRQPGLLLHC
jgi:hypothetical protein